MMGPNRGKEMSQKKSKADYFKNLSWNDLEDWAGSKIVSRGENYQKSRYVRELARTPDGALVAWVQGTEKYATLVDFEKRDLVSECTCSFGTTCKHAVAVVLEYLHLLKQDKEIPEAIGRKFKSSDSAPPSSARPGTSAPAAHKPRDL